jgi:PEP-CTERM motif
MRTGRSWWAIVALLFCTPQFAHATLVTFTSRSAWQSAVTAGGLSVQYNEGFENFTSDTSFRNAPLNVNGHFTLSQTGTDQVFRNLIDVPPFDFADNDGTKSASLYTNFGTATTGTFVNMTFSSPIVAWGGDFSQDTLLELLNMSVNSPSNTLLTTYQVPDTANATFFFGFVGSPSDLVGSLTFLSRTNIDGSSGEGFGLDNVTAATAVPEPASWVLLGSAVGAIALTFRRRR